MKLVMPMAAAMMAAGFALPALAQTGADTDSRARLDRCANIADPGLRARCMNQSFTGQDRLLMTPGAPATAPLVPTTPSRPDIVPGQPPRQ